LAPAPEEAGVFADIFKLSDVVPRFWPSSALGDNRFTRRGGPLVARARLLLCMNEVAIWRAKLGHFKKIALKCYPSGASDP
jgi:hypothetical protein